MLTDISHFPLVGMSLILIVLTLAMSVLSHLKRKTECHPELIRKALHIFMGLMTLSFPFIFDQAWPVAVLSIVSAVILSMVGKFSLLLSWGAVLKADGRTSYGQICFPLAIGILFTLTFGDPLLFCVPVLILTLADAVSALVGVRYGKHKYFTIDGAKSTEGSLAFFTFALLGTLIPLILVTDMPDDRILFTSLIMGILAMLFEGIAWRGFDNLAIPLGAYAVLKTHLVLNAEELCIRLLILAILLTFTICWRHKTTLTGSAILGVALFAYFAYTVGGLAWLAMPLTVFIFYRWFMPTRFQTIENTHSMYAVLSVASTGILWLFWSHSSNSPEFIYPYTLAFAAHTAIIMIAHIRSRGMNRLRLRVIFKGTMRSWLLLFLPFIIVSGFSAQTFVLALVAPLFILLPVIAFYLTQNNIRNTSKTRWAKQAAFAVMASFLGLIPVALL